MAGNTKKVSLGDGRAEIEVGVRIKRVSKGETEFTVVEDPGEIEITQAMLDHFERTLLQQQQQEKQDGDVDR